MSETDNGEVARLREALARLLELIDHVGLGDTRNGVTDSTGSIDEGDVRASDIVAYAQAALHGEPDPRAVMDGYCINREEDPETHPTIADAGRRLGRAARDGDGAMLSQARRIHDLMTERDGRIGGPE